MAHESDRAEKFGPVTRESVEKTREKLKQGSRKKAFEEGKFWKGNAETSDREFVYIKTWGSTEGDIESGLREPDLYSLSSGFSDVLPSVKGRRSIDGYLHKHFGKEKLEIGFNVLVVGCIAGKFAQDIHAIPELKKIQVTGVALSDPRPWSDKSKSKYKRYEKLERHEIITADVLSEGPHMGAITSIDVHTGKTIESSIALDGISSLPKRKYNCIVGQDTTVGSSAESMYLVTELITKLYELLEQDGVLIYPLPSNFPTRLFFNRLIQIKNADGKRGLKVSASFKESGGNLMIERNGKSPDSIRDILSIDPVIKINDIRASGKK